MSDGLTTTAPPEPSDAPPTATRTRRPARVVVPLQASVIMVAFAGVGALAGLLWYRAWDVPHGVVVDGQWYTNEAGLRDDFAGTAWYVTIAVLAGLVLGVLSAWLLDRSELVTLLAVAAGSVLAAYLMLRVGHHFSAADPHELAKTAKDGTKLDGALTVDSWPPKAAFPFGALVGLAVVYAASVSRAPDELHTQG